jgi:16S rRNA (uracil1498-N3)-methyltransferase
MITMQIFYSPGISGESWTLDEKESRHCIRVLRMRKDTPVRMIDGRGNMYEGAISDPDPVKCEITIKKVINGFEKRNYNLHIAISPLKNPERFEWFVEKSVEIGIDEITPLICRNTEKKSIKTERIKNIIISAMKQSLKAKLTILNEPVPFNEFFLTKEVPSKMIAHCSPADNKKSIADVYKKGTDALIIIGPEGDFSEDEIRLALDKSFIPVHLGSSRLRTETAGIAACHSVYFLNQ